MKPLLQVRENKDFFILSSNFCIVALEKQMITRSNEKYLLRNSFSRHNTPRLHPTPTHWQFLSLSEAPFIGRATGYHRLKAGGKKSWGITNISQKSFFVLIQKTQWCGTTYRKSEARRSVHRMGRHAPDSFGLAPPYPQDIWGVHTVPVRVSYQALYWQFWFYRKP